MGQNLVARSTCVHEVEREKRKRETAKEKQGERSLKAKQTFHCVCVCVVCKKQKVAWECCSGRWAWPGLDRTRSRHHLDSGTRGGNCSVSLWGISADHTSLGRGHKKQGLLNDSFAGQKCPINALAIHPSPSLPRQTRQNQHSTRDCSSCDSDVQTRSLVLQTVRAFGRWVYHAPVTNTHIHQWVTLFKLH